MAYLCKKTELLPLWHVARTAESGLVFRSLTPATECHRRKHLIQDMITEDLGGLPTTVIAMDCV